MHTRTSRTGHRGAALVEFALTLPLLVLLVFITTEFGRAVYEYHVVVKSVRSGARYLAMQLPGTNVSNAQLLVRYGNFTGTGTPLARGLPGATVNCTWSPGAGTVATYRTVTVTVTGYQFTSVTTSVFGQAFGSLTFPAIQATLRSQL